jgi:hypothetical protein
MNQVAQLFQLQELDLEIGEKKQRLGEVLHLLKGPSALVEAKEALETAVSQHKRAQSHQKQLSDQLQQLTQKAKNAENRLYSGTVKNPKELEDLQHSIESMKKQRASLEDELLEAMILLEEAETHLQEAREVAERLEAQWQQDSVQLAQEKETLARWLAEKMEVRKGEAARVPANLLERYELIRKRRGGTAVVRVRGESCLGCRISISAHRLREAREGKIVYCDGCGRILFPYG